MLACQFSCRVVLSSRCPDRRLYVRWVLREYMMYHHDRQPQPQGLHPEMYDEDGNMTG